MSLILSGTDGLSDVDGSAATPAIRGTDANTGMFFPAADTIAFSEGGVESMRIDSSGNVGIGTSSPAQKLQVVGTLSSLGGSITANMSSDGSNGVYETNGACFLRSTTSNPVILGTNNTERMRIDSSGNVGIGTTTPATIGALLSTVANANIGVGYFRNLATSGITSDQLQVGVSQSTSLTSFYLSRFYTNVTTSPAVMHHVRGDGEGYFAGNVGIGSSSPTTKLQVTGTIHLTGAGSFPSTGVGLEIVPSVAGGTNYIQAYNRTGSAWQNLEISSAQTVFGTGGTERMRIDSSGNLLFAKTTTSVAASNGLIIDSSGVIFATLDDPSAAVNTYHLFNRNATNNGFRFYVNSNGGLYNFSGNNVNISDERTKKNIEVAGSYLDKICSIPVKLFNYKDEAEGEQRTLGVIAQDVEAVAPEFVNSTDGWEGTEPKDGIPLKTIYSTDLMFGMMKAIQELKATVDAQAVEIAALKAK